MKALPRSFGLVLGSGGVLGASFHAGVLLALAECWGIDARKSTEILGTSAGALTGALVSSGLSPHDLMRREQTLPLSAAGQKVLKRRGSVSSSGMPKPTIVGAGWPAAPQLGLPAMRRPGTVMPGTVLAGLLPRGKSSTEGIESLVDGVLQGEWPDEPRLRSVAVSLSTGRREVFSATSGAAIGLAVAASCAVPGLHAPVSIDGTDYIDGATHSANNLDAVGSHDVVLVSSPSTGPALGIGPMAAARVLWGMQLRRESKSLSSTTLVVIVEPDRVVLDAMGSDPMATSRRASVAMAAHGLATALFTNQQNPIDT